METVTVYTIDELPTERARQKAIENTRHTFDVFEQLDVDYTKQLLADSNRPNGIEIEKVYYSGFYSQGDGASFTGKIYPATLLTVLGHDPSQYENHGVVNILRNNSRYVHEMTMFLEDEDEIYSEEHLEVMLRFCRDVAVGFYKDLETQYEYCMTDEYIVDYLREAEFFRGKGQEIYLQHFFVDGTTVPMICM